MNTNEKHNLHALVPSQKYERIREISYMQKVSKGELVRRGLDLVISEYDKGREEANADEK